MTTYTAVLLADTAVPAWHDAHRELPFVFAGSALAAGGGIGLAGRRATCARPAASPWPGRRSSWPPPPCWNAGSGSPRTAYTGGRRRAAADAARGRDRAGAAAAAAGGLVPGRRGRLLSLAAAALLNGGAAATRFGVFDAGMVTARDPAYTVQPQRARVEARRAGYPWA